MPTPPFYSGGASSSEMTPPDGSARRMALDNIFRRELRVSDPSDPMQVAQALLTRYKDSPRAQAISQEAKGLPFLQSVQLPSMVPQATTSSDAELQQAKDDVDRDLHELTTNALLKDVTPELQGWAQGVRSAIQAGTTAARFALDPRQRDQAFATRRQLGDYARMARLVGALTPTLNLNYRKFAQSLDEVAGVILVSMGESLANVGFNGGRFLLQAPYSELQARRDAAIYALRNLIGATQEAYALPNEWPRGLDAYRRLFDLLEKQGQGDLRALLVEHELARTMDELIQRAAHGRAEGMRALGSTAQLDLERFRRMVIIAQRVVKPESPPLTSFLEALQLFADAFESSGGFRLTRIARPPILFYGLYGTTTFEAADQRLLELIIQRGLLADQLDCFLQCGCTAENITCQIVLDKILYDVDRAIDLYALGQTDFGEPERRAAAYSFVIEHFTERSGLVASTTSTVHPKQCKLPDELAVFGTPRDPTPTEPGPRILVGGILSKIIEKLRPGLNLLDPDVATVVNELFGFGQRVLSGLDKLSQEKKCDTVSSTDPALCAKVLPLISPLTATSTDAIDDDIGVLAAYYSAAQQGRLLLSENLPKDFVLPTEPPSVTSFLGMLQQELCIQADMEERWRNLVKSMAPNCFGIDKVLDAVEKVIEGAIDLVSGEECPIFQPSIPPHYETALDAIANDVDPLGVGR